MFKAAYTFIDDFYIHLNSDFENYIVYLDMKGKEIYPDPKEFQNEMLIQETRKIVNDRTINIREIMYARSLASTVIDEIPEEIAITSENAERILVDWFEKHE